jgi:hypothetical protein
MEPSGLVAATTKRSPFFTQLFPVVSKRLFWRVTISSPTPALWPSAIARPDSVTAPSATRPVLARRFSSVTVALSPAIIRLDLPAFDVGLPGRVDGVQQALPIAARDAVVGLVDVDGRGVPGSKLDTGGLLPLGAETTDVGELGDEITAVFDEEGEGPAGFHRRHLRMISEKQNLGTGRRGGAHELVEGEGPSQ